MDKSNGADRVVKVIRVYQSGRVRAARPGANDKPVSGVPWGRPRAHAVPEDKPTATPAPAAKPKDPKKVAAGKARAEKARLAKEAAAKKKPAAKKPKAKKATAKVTKKATPKKTAMSQLAETLTRGKAKTPAAPKAPKGANAMVVVAFRLSKPLKAKLKRLGGADFLRERIERAPIPQKG
jgi:hypothetical protein